MDAKFGDLRGVVSVLASMHPAWQNVTMAAPSEPLRQERHMQAQREDDAEQAELDGTVEVCSRQQCTDFAINKHLFFVFLSLFSSSHSLLPSLSLSLSAVSDK